VTGELRPLRDAFNRRLRALTLAGLREVSTPGYPMETRDILLKADKVSDALIAPDCST
jgi:hypothetical protein